MKFHRYDIRAMQVHNLARARDGASYRAVLDVATGKLNVYTHRQDVAPNITIPLDSVQVEVGGMMTDVSDVLAEWMGGSDEQD